VPLSKLVFFNIKEHALNKKTAVVFGATGVAGSAVVASLLKNDWQVRAVSHNPKGDKARTISEMGAEVVEANLDKRSSIVEVVKGVDAVYLSGPSLQNRWDIGQAAQGINVVDGLLEAGDTKHFIYQSALTSDARGVLSVGSKRAIEERIAEVEIPATISRPGLFMDNFLTFLKPQRQGDKLIMALPLPLDKNLGLISSRDIGEAAAAILSDPGQHVGGEYDLVSDIISFKEMAAIVSEELGETVHPIQVSFEALEAQWPEGVSLYRWLSGREYKDSTQGLRRLTGRVTNFREWARDNLLPIIE